MNKAQVYTIQQAHKNLAQLVKAYNKYELTTHNWEALVVVIKNMESLFDFLPESKAEVMRLLDEV